MAGWTFTSKKGFLEAGTFECEIQLVVAFEDLTIVMMGRAGRVFDVCFSPCAHLVKGVRQ
jgi:hypothetical protein